MRASALLRDAQRRANHDALTGLPNRPLFLEAAEHHLAACRESGNKLAVLFIDFDGFKSVNDRHGHGTGDELLREIAMRLRNAIRGFDLAARLGGDEFAVLLVGLRSDAAARVAGELVDVLSLPYPIGRLALQLSASIGVAEYPVSGTTMEALVASADRAMYEAKAAGKGRAVVADAA
ncbi:MAG: GGDEF domain-containing protein [Xanthobacteraceae bacterium]|nr:GGDEF domain-containing protein [Xanthobacteraceae bacterium]